jgi:uncharacterized protein YndB with AHSA1/START domain
MTTDTQTRSVELEIEIDAPADAAFHAVATPEGLARWFPPISGGSGAAGEKILISWGEAMEWWTNVVVSDAAAGHVRWVDDEPPADSGWPQLATDWFIETRGGRTVVRLVNSGFGASSEWDEQYNSVTAGWKYFLFNLRHYLEHHPGTPRVAIWERRKSPVSRTEFWNRLVGAVGLAIGDVHTGDTPSMSLGAQTHTARVEHVNVPSHLWLRVASLGESLLFVEVEGSGDAFHAGLYLSTYGLPESQVAGLRDDLRAVADRVFAA